jgi:hypothetical protein
MPCHHAHQLQVVGQSTLSTPVSIFNTYTTSFPRPEQTLHAISAPELQATVIAMIGVNRALTLLTVAFAPHLVSGSTDTFLERAIKLMEESPLVDTHIDLLQIVRSLSR